MPIYFMFFPLGYSDEKYARFFNDDDVFGIAKPLTDEEREALRRRIIALAIFSMAFATVVAPWLCGFIAAFYLSTNQFIEFIWFLMIVKSLLICISLHNIYNGDTFITQSNSFLYVIIIYGVYLVLIFQGVTSSYEWTIEHINATGFIGLVVGLLRRAYSEVFVNIVLVSLVTWAVTNRQLDPRLARAYSNEKSLPETSDSKDPQKAG